MQIEKMLPQLLEMIQERHFCRISWSSRKLMTSKRKLGLSLVQRSPRAPRTQFTQFLVELIDILKVPVYRSETHVGYVVPAI